jgi:4-amino-4-deoxy-L-arabinose transferase-like glycosyltransferase
MPKKNENLSEISKKEKPAFRWVWIALIVLAFLLGLRCALYDLTDAPLDFHPTRQLHSALIARGMYYQTLKDAPEWQKELSYKQWQKEGLIEPQIMERLTAWTYQLIGSAQLWAARVWAILFWTIGGVFLCLLANDLFGLAGSALAVIYFMLWPYAVASSRAFQPDSLMVAAIIIGLWAAERWLQKPTWGRVILAGLSCGLAIYIKSVAVFFIAPALAGLLLTNFRFRDLIRNKQVWLLFVLAVSPYLAYHIYAMYVLKLLESQFSLRFFPNLWVDPVFYLQWIGEIKSVMELEIFLPAVVALMILPRKQWKGMLIGLLVGYLIYGFTFSYHISTHDYYQMPMLAVTALGLAALFDYIVEHLPQQNRFNITVIALVLVGFMALRAWDSRVAFKKVNYHDETRFWENWATNSDTAAA